jgi:SpoVK/Ycf46/Vps4 family AAA+-type ATPase
MSTIQGIEGYTPSLVLTTTKKGRYIDKELTIPNRLDYILKLAKKKINYCSSPCHSACQK